ncbi:unnamed protein product [Linum trigynum]|uniref:Uncharacterized protein n=1 Tax=Linum trigynum TaxID=586398 RepID=A0AAV2EYB7_9ROSI
MGSNVYSYNHHHHQQQQAVVESNNNGGRSCERRSRSALPMLCSRNSTKDVVAVAVPFPARSGTPFSGGSGGGVSESEEPVSPKIGCMGQVKRNNRIGGFPAPASASASSSYSSIAAKFHPPPLPAVKYLKLKRVFSARNLTTASSERPNLVSKNGNVDADRRHKSSSSCSASGMVAVNIEEIDPPLPVRSKRFEKEATQSEMSLWERRRSGRMGLKNLELQGIVPQQIPSSKFQPTTV